MTVSLHEQLACARRELRMRQRVYPRRLVQQTMTQDEAEREIAVMAAIVATLQGLIDAGLGQLGLFEKEQS